jgi:hypothetical protein
VVLHQNTLGPLGVKGVFSHSILLVNTPIIENKNSDPNPLLHLVASSLVDV